MSEVVFSKDKSQSEKAHCGKLSIARRITDEWEVTKGQRKEQRTGERLDREESVDREQKSTGVKSKRCDHPYCVSGPIRE
jgi:hypothetical protein